MTIACALIYLISFNTNFKTSKFSITHSSAQYGVPLGTSSPLCQIQVSSAASNFPPTQKSPVKSEEHKICDECQDHHIKYLTTTH